ncbi:DUF4275 family protein [Robertmurraya sp. Marseille-Q9965]
MEELFNILKNKKIRVTEIDKWGTYLRNQWEHQFVGHLSKDERYKIFLYDDRWSCGYLWHVFSYKRRECLEGASAVQNFDLEPKGACYIFYQHSDYALLVEEARLLKASDLLNEEDVYVVDKEFNWTFVNTHESDWLGPYFSRKNKV